MPPQKIPFVIYCIFLKVGLCITNILWTMSANDSQVKQRLANYGIVRILAKTLSRVCGIQSESETNKSSSLRNSNQHPLIVVANQCESLSTPVKQDLDSNNELPVLPSLWENIELNAALIFHILCLLTHYTSCSVQNMSSIIKSENFDTNHDQVDALLGQWSKSGILKIIFKMMGSHISRLPFQTPLLLGALSC